MAIANITNNILTDSGTLISSLTPTSITISTTAPLQGGGDLSANRTLSITQSGTASNGYLSSTDWNTFNGKGSGTVTSVAALTIGTSGTDLSSSVANSTTTPVITLNVPTASATNRGALSAADWTTFNNKQSALTNPVTGTGNNNYLAKFTSTGSTIGNSNLINDASGNLGLGVTPSAWWSDMKAIEAQGSSGGVFASASINGHFLTNAYYNGTNWIYKNTAFVSYYSQTSGQHQWLTAPSGTAGNAITFTQAMTLTASGRLLINKTNEETYQLDVNGTGRFTSNIITTGATAEIMANGSGSSNSVGGSSRFTILDSSNNRGWILQQNASYNLSFWHYNSGWSNVINFTPTGAATFSSSVTATSFFESSSIKGKDIIATNPLLALDIDVIKYTRKSDESKDIRYGYSAEQIHSLMPELTDKDVTAVKYLDVHTILIAQLQKEIKELKAKMN